MARLELERLKRTTRFEIEQAQTDRSTRLAALAQAQRRLDVAELIYQEVEERFRYGLATSLEQADAQVELFDARVGLQVACLQLRLAELALLQTTGAPLPLKAL